MLSSDLRWNDLGFFGQGITAAARQWRAAARKIGDEYSLGPRGPWILGLIASGRAQLPSDLSNFFKCSKGLITAELAKLTDAGLVIRQTSGEDGRRVELSLTPIGENAVYRLANLLIELMQDRMANYSREELLLCARMLCDFGETGYWQGSRTPDSTAVAQSDTS